MRLCRTSLAALLDTINAEFFFKRPVFGRTAQQAAALIASRFGLPGAYAETFALFPTEIDAGILLFTGERATNASARHIAAQESCRVLNLLAPQQPDVQQAFISGTRILMKRVGPPAPTNPPPDSGHVYWNWDYRGGTYCCGPCTVGFWRHLLGDALGNHSTRLNRGLACLKTHRKPDGTWRRFPYWYTLSALIEMPRSPAALNELRFAAPKCERIAKTSPHRKIRRASR